MNKELEDKLNKKIGIFNTEGDLSKITNSFDRKKFLKLAKKMQKIFKKERTQCNSTCEHK